MIRSKLLSIHRAALVLAGVLLFAGESQGQRVVSFCIPGGGGGYQPYGGGYNPYGGGYYSPSYYYTSPTFMSSYTSTSYIVPVLTSTSSSPRTINEKAAIEVQVPANAQVWFDGTQTAQKGSER